MKIRVLKLGEAATEITLPEGSNVQQAMDLLAERNDWRWNGYTVMVNGSIAVGWTPLKDGGRSDHEPEGGRRGQGKDTQAGRKRPTEVDVPKGSTLAEAFVAANLNTAGYSNNEKRKPSQYYNADIRG